MPLAAVFTVGPMAQHTAPTLRTPSVIYPWPPQHAGPRRDKVNTRLDKKTGRIATLTQLAEPFPQVVAGDGFEPSKA